MADTAEELDAKLSWMGEIKRHRTEIVQLKDKVLNDVAQRKIQLAALKTQAQSAPFGEGDVATADELIAFQQSNLVSTVVSLLTLPGMAQILTASGYMVTAPQ